MKNFVTAAYVKENLACLKILEVREDYEKGHIPGSIFFDIDLDLADPIKEHGGRHPMPADETLEHLFGQRGLALDDEIVCVDDGDYAYGGRLWWMLKYLGFTNVKVMIGGYMAWVATGGEVSTEVATIVPNPALKVKPQKDIAFTMEEVKTKLIPDPTIALVDSRSAIRYRGEEEPIDFKKGHIPSALNYPYEEVLAGDPVPDPVKLREHYKALFDYDQVVVYCGSGITATVNALLMEEAGLAPKLYPGSFSDWISYPENQINTTEI